MLLGLPLLTASLALQTPPTRRAAIVGAFATATAPLAVHAETQLEAGGALGSTCLGFGCNPYGRPDFNGMPAAESPKNALPYPEFLKALQEKKVEGVVFQPPFGNEAYALIDGKSIRIGEGWPVEVSNSWSSPTWVARILQNEGVPYVYNFDLKVKPKVRSGPPERYDPSASRAKGEASSSPWFETPANLGKPPKMYGDGTF